MPPILEPPAIDQGRTWPGGSFEPLAARIIARVRQAPGSDCFVVNRDGMPPLEVRLLSQVVATVETDPRAIALIERIGEDGLREALFARD